MTIHQGDRLPSDIRGYHRRTKHAPNRYALGPAFLDWTSQPSPYRSFAGSPQIMLPLHDGGDTPSFPGPAPRAAKLDRDALGLFLELAFGLSAWKSVEGSTWALRNNPSSGNLHPTEAWVILGAGDVGADTAALYHYAPLDHALEFARQFRGRGSASAGRLSARARLHCVAGGLEIWRARLSLLSARRRPCDRRGGSSRGGARLARACPLRAVRRRNSRAAWPRAGRRRASARARAPRTYWPGSKSSARSPRLSTCAALSTRRASGMARRTS